MVKILDCTIRDGGYLTGWNFTDKFVADLYNCASNSGIDYFEAGYKGKGTTEFADFDESYIENHFVANDNCKLTLMVEIDKFDISQFKKNKFIKTVRIATYPYDIIKSFDTVLQLKELGFEVFLNLMASSRYTNNEFEILKGFKNKTLIDVIVISDTFGAFTPESLETMYKHLKNIGYEHIGFHSHNNKNLALKNTIKAIELGADVVDATLFGAGRWAGNTDIIKLLKYLDINISEYESIQAKYKNIFNDNFGYNEFTKLSGDFNVHPYYVKKLMKNMNSVEIELFLMSNASLLPIKFDEKTI